MPTQWWKHAQPLNCNPNVGGLNHNIQLSSKVKWWKLYRVTNTYIAIASTEVINEYKLLGIVVNCTSFHEFILYNINNNVINTINFYNIFYNLLK